MQIGQMIVLMGLGLMDVDGFGLVVDWLDPKNITRLQIIAFLYPEEILVLELPIAS